MKFLSLFVAGAAAATISKRTIDDVLSAVQTISDQTQSLTTAVQGFGGAADAAALQSASETLISDINDGTSAAEGSDPFTPDEALQLTTPIGDLNTQVQTATQAVIDARSTFDDAGVSSIVLDQLTQIRDAANAFSAAVIDKVPEDLQTIAQNLAAPISEALDNAVSAYADATGGSSSTGAASTTAAASTTGAAATTTAVYPTGTAPGASTTTTVPVGTGVTSSYPTGTAPISPPIATGGAASNAAGFGAVAMAALAAVAAF